MSNSNRSASNSTSFFLQNPDETVNVQQVLEEGFAGEAEFTELKIMTATTSREGVLTVESQLRDFCNEGGSVQVFIGLGLGPEPEAIRTLRDIQDDYPGLVSIHLVETGSQAGLFHPKVYWFHGDESDLAIVTSANWSDRGFTESIEATTVLRSDSSESSTPAYVDELRTAFHTLSSLGAGDEWATLYPPMETVLSELESESRDHTMPRVSQEIDLSGIDIENDSLWPLSRTAPELVLDVLGESRVTQLVPTHEVWDRFFDIDPDRFTTDSSSLPSFELTNIRTGETELRPVVEHHHQGTIEIPELAERSDPGEGNDFIIFRQYGAQAYEYELFLDMRDSQAEAIEQIEEFISSNGFTTGNTRRAFIHSP